MMKAVELSLLLYRPSAAETHYSQHGHDAGQPAAPPAGEEGAGSVSAGGPEHCHPPAPPHPRGRWLRSCGTKAPRQDAEPAGGASQEVPR